jgi:uncharacterized membrane protein
VTESRPSSATPRSIRSGVEWVERSEAVDHLVARLEPIADQVARGGRRPILEGRWLGHALHPLLTDFPLGCWIGATLLDLLGGRRGRKAARRLVGAGVLAAVPTAAAGLADWRLVGDTATRRVGAVHAIGGTTTTLLYARSWLLRWRHPVAGAIAGAVAGGVALLTGFLGGHLTLVRQAGAGRRDWPLARPAPGDDTSPHGDPMYAEAGGR